MHMDYIYRFLLTTLLLSSTTYKFCYDMKQPFSTSRCCLGYFWQIYNNLRQPYYIQMPERKVWNQHEDKILKFLKEEQGETKWSAIARKMQTDFGIEGRTGKQCRERYYNHLDKSILTTPWTKEEEKTLLQMHEDVGNKWSAISLKLPGRSDNCVKNHFYSRLRKSVRRLNKLINDTFKKDYREIKISTLYNILQICQNSYKNNSKYDEEYIQHCQNIKKQLYLLDQYSNSQLVSEKGLEKTRKLIIELIEFENKQKRSRSNKQHKDSTSTMQSRTKQQRSQVKRENTEDELYWILKRVCEEYMQKQNV